MWVVSTLNCIFIRCNNSIKENQPKIMVIWTLNYVFSFLIYHSFHIYLFLLLLLPFFRAFKWLLDALRSYDVSNKRLKCNHRNRFETEKNHKCYKMNSQNANKWKLPSKWNAGKTPNKHKMCAVLRFFFSIFYGSVFLINVQVYREMAISLYGTYFDYIIDIYCVCEFHTTKYFI